MPIEIRFITAASAIDGPVSPVLGWINVKPSKPYQYNDGVQDLNVSDAVIVYNVTNGAIDYSGVPANTITVKPTEGAANDPADVFWDFEFDLNGGSLTKLRLLIPAKLRYDKQGSIEIGDRNPGTALLGTLILLSPANQAARLLLPSIVGQRVHQLDTDEVYEQIAAPATNPANWTNVTVRWSDIVVTQTSGVSDNSSLAAHLLAADPHPQYLLKSETVDEATPGTASDGRGYGVRADNVTGKIDPSFIDAAAIDIDANEVEFVPGGTLVSTNVQAALLELDGDNVADAAALAAHLADAVDAHDASAISNIPAGSVAATTVQAAINEIATEYAAADAAISAAKVSKTGDQMSGTLNSTASTPIVSKVAGDAVILFEDNLSVSIARLIKAVSGATDYIALQALGGIGPSSLGIAFDGVNADFPFFDNDNVLWPANFEALLRLYTHGPTVAALGFTVAVTVKTLSLDVGQYYIFAPMKMLRQVGGTGGVSASLVLGTALGTIGAGVGGTYSVSTTGVGWGVTIPCLWRVIVTAAGTLLLQVSAGSSHDHQISQVVIEREK